MNNDTDTPTFILLSLLQSIQFNSRLQSFKIKSNATQLIKEKENNVTVTKDGH